MDNDNESSRATGRASHRAAEELEVLIDACIHGDSHAWGQFVEQYGRLVYAIPARMGLRPDACDDVFQSVFAIAIRELPRIRDRASIPKWLMTVAHHESCRWLRRHRGTAASSGRPPVVEPEPAEDELLRLERRQIVHDNIERLGGRCRELLIALFFDINQPSYEEVSRRLGLPVGAIGPTRKRCLQKLLELIGDQLDD